MPSQLTFDATENFRRKLLIKNLEPYNESYKGNDTAGEKEFSLKDFSVIDSQNIETSTINDESKNKAFIKNQYGPEGGYKDIVDIVDIEKKIEKRLNYYTFIASEYNPLSIILNSNPTGTNGSLSQDSTLAQLSASRLKTEFEFRIAEETYQQTLGRVNVLDALEDPFDALAIATGNEQVIESDWKISVPDNVVGKGLDLISRISGVYSPYSWIPGSYFSNVEPQSSITQASSASGSFVDKGTLSVDANRRSSELFLSNTGRGQTKRLFKGISLNVFAPDYTDNARSFGLKPPPGNYYIGTKDTDAKDIVSPPTELPIDQYGNRDRVPVRGYGELGKQYENSYPFKFGLNGTKFLRSNTFTNSSYDAPRLQGGFTWVSFEGIKGSGRNVTQGGSMGSTDPNFSSSVASSWDSTISTQYDFKAGSILDDTQRLINAAEGLQGDARLQHVGNAISQVSKVFNDGTREMTKGSMVYKYEDTNTGEIKGYEYCRVFTKDIPYFTNSDLQKTEGIVDSNRRFSYSVLNNTYNLNIAPWRDQDSSNIQESKVKKYMFSIENLAWRTSSKPGFTYQDLPACEKGPNGGRIMWFPPYDLKFSEQNSVNWTSNEFLGRPEPIFTYNNTTRNGNLSWKIIVDHPSILNAIVDKELAKENNQKVNDIVDSFFAGCRNYDIYELATRFPQFTIKDIYDIVTTTTDIVEYETYSKEIQRTETKITDPVIEEYTPVIQVEDYRFEFYFDNDSPPPRSAASVTTTEDYASSLASYIGRKDTYIESADEDQKVPIQEFFDTFIIDSTGKNIIENNTKELTNKIKTAIDKGATINIEIRGSASSVNSNAYNDSISKRRIDSIKKYIMGFSELNKYQDKVNITEVSLGEDTNVTPGAGSYGTYNCSEDLEGVNKVYSVTAMACRAVIVELVTEIPPEPNPEDTEPIIEEFTITDTVTGKTEVIRQEENKNISPKQEVAKVIVKKLLNECDYFNMMKEESPRIYEGIKEKIKYFQPAFHSTTPEGLNSRLTFLQQCIRPGDTIPVIGEDGKPREGDVKNTSFGAPPICILRVGDFYHTKIAIQQISVNFEPLTLDLNPEGIGVQPMLADITMSFYFIGGQGLKEPISRLQNALSFNYYANSEIFDDRAVSTDLESRDNINKIVMDQIESLTDFSVKDGKIERSEEAGDTIGEITTTNIEGDYLGGEINYKTPVKDFVSKSQSYTQNVINSLETISKEQSIISLYYFTNTRSYKDGNITGSLDNNDVLSANIFGKPTNVEDRVNDLYSLLLSDIEDNSNPFLSKISLENFKNSEIKKFKKRIRNFIDLTRDTFQTNFNSVMGDLTNNQTELVRVIDKLNLILTETDGYATKSGRLSILSLSGTSDVDVSSQASNTKEELLNDIQTIGFDLQAFYDSIFESGGLLPPKENLYNGFLSDTFDTQPQTRFCTVAYPFLIQDPEYFIELILGEELISSDEWVKYVNKIIYGTNEVPNNLTDILGSEGLNTPILPSQPGLLEIYKKLQSDTSSQLKTFKENDFVKNFTLYQPFNPDKERKFTYLQKFQEESDANKVTYFETTFKGQNGGALDKYNLKYSFNQ